MIRCSPKGIPKGPRTQTIQIVGSLKRGVIGRERERERDIYIYRVMRGLDMGQGTQKTGLWGPNTSTI